MRAIDLIFNDMMEDLYYIKLATFSRLKEK